ncbi:MAG: putative MFS-type transporter [Ktedonobacterales bacterium]|jgi:MFS family permease|nr:MAG: putative MFS-type transporter [Ktedonobacterales bacterium]
MALDAAITQSTAGVAATQRHRSLGELISISIFWFAINFHWAAILLILIPSQVTGLLFQAAPGATIAARSDWVLMNRPLVVALVEAPGLIVALIANPLFGLLSDRTPGRFGRRRPYILGGTALNVVGLAVMALGPALVAEPGNGNPLAPSLLMLMAGLMLTQLANNAAAAPFHALLPDLVPQEQRGKASGIMGLALFLGQIGGALVPIFFAFNSASLLDGSQPFATFAHGITLTYGAIAVVISLMAVLTALTVHEPPWHGDTISAAHRAADQRTWRALVLTVLAVLLFTGAALVLFRFTSLTADSDSISILQLIAVILAGIGAAYAFGFSPRRNPDFSWVVLTRMLVMQGVYMVQTFLLLYMGDVAHAPSPEGATTTFIIILTLTATVSTLFAGWGSDRIGRKRMVYVSGAFMAVVGAAFVLAPYLVPGQVLTLAFGSAAVFGLGYGAYVSVDWALVADVLPSETTFARDMGVWNIGLTLPQVFAAIFGGWVLSLGIALGSKQFGYTLLFVWFVVFCVLGTVTVRNIKGVKR